MSGIDDAEWLGLQRILLDIERGMPVSAESRDATAGVTPAVFAEWAKHRVEALENEGAVGAAHERKEKEQYQSVTVAYAVLREHNLTAAEKESFGSFLHKEFFTRADFGDLNQFYGSAWDRLCEEGKAEMSYRVWEGIRRGEYSFTDLPENTRKKEAERLYEQLSAKELPENLSKIPQEDRDNFMAAMKAGRHKEAHEILNGEEFADHVSPEPENTTTAKLQNRAQQTDAKNSATQDRDDRSEDNEHTVAKQERDSLKPHDIDITASPSLPASYQPSR